MKKIHRFEGRGRQKALRFRERGGRSRERYLAHMTDLAQKRCAPCTGQTPRLAPEDVTRLLPSVPGYSPDPAGVSITKAYEFANFYETMAFVNAVAFIAHAEDHHPELTVSYGRCVVTYSTHAIGGLSENDFICAAKIEALPR